jgi:hypothetical protein
MEWMRSTAVIALAAIKEHMEVWREGEGGGGVGREGGRENIIHQSGGNSKVEV